MAEQLICNQQVVGSTPITSSTKVHIRGLLYGSVPERPKGADCKSVVTDFGGPNPPAPTKNAEQFRSASENRRFSPVFFIFLRFPRFFKNRTPCKTCRSDRSFSLYGVDSDWKNGYLRQFFRACLSE